MEAITQEIRDDIREIVFDYFSEECDIDKSEITDQTDIIVDLEGDSLMLLSLLEIFRKKYGLTIELKTLGKHLMSKPANTIGEVMEMTLQIVKYGNDIVNMEF